MCRFALTLQQTPPRALRSSFMIREEEDKKEEVVAFFLFIFYMNISHLRGATLRIANLGLRRTMV